MIVYVLYINNFSSTTIAVEKIEWYLYISSNFDKV